MISRIALTVITAALTASVSPAESESPFVELNGKQILKFNLGPALDPQTRATILTAVEAEMRTTKGTDLHLDELWLAKGVLLSLEKDWKGALEALRKVNAHPLLLDARLYYEAKVLSYLGMDAQKSGKFKDALASCSEAKGRYESVIDQGNGPFFGAAKEEREKLAPCILVSAAQLGQIPGLEGPAVALLNSGEDLEAGDREKLVQSLVKLWKSQGRTEEANLLMAAESKATPSEKTREGGSPSSAPAPLPLKARELPEEQLLVQAAKKQNAGRFEDALRLLGQVMDEYPGSTIAQKAEGRYLSIADALSKKKVLPKYLADSTRKLPPDSFFEVVKLLWQRDQDDVAYDLFKDFVSRYPNHSKSGSVFFFLGRIEENRGNWEKAREFFKMVVAKYSANALHDFAHFKVGFLSYLLKEDSTALEWLEYNRALLRTSISQAKAIYWIGRVYDRQGKSSEAERYRDEIGRVAPLTYYAFLVNRLPQFKEPDPGSPPKPKVFENSRLLARTMAFMASGLHTAAAKTLSQIDLELEPNLAVQVGLLYNAIRKHNPAFKIAYSLADNAGPEGLPAAVSKLLFPADFEGNVRKEAKTNELDPMLVFSVIKQESAYQEDAESRAGALGLMQLMPATASNVAREVRASSSGHPDLLRGETNIRLGVRYLSNTIKHYGGNVLQALAAYNAGTERVDLWVKQWGKLDPVEFVEMIPFEETRNYVKSITRNYAFYSLLLEKRSVTLQDLSPP